MPDIKTQTDIKSSKPVDPRAILREQRARRFRLVNEGKNATIKVFAANEDFRTVLRHPGGARFTGALDQPVEWPHDSFTARRIADGSVLTEAASGEPAPLDDSLNPRQQAAARNAKESKDSKDHRQPPKPQQQPQPVS